MKKIFKTFACCLGVLAIAFTAFFVPITKKSVSADEVPQQRASFQSDNFYSPLVSAYTSSTASWNNPSTYFTLINYQFTLTSSQFSLTGYNLNFNIKSYVRGSGQLEYNFNDYNFFSNTTSSLKFAMEDYNDSATYYIFLGFILVPNSEQVPTLNMQTLEYGSYTSFVNSVSPDYFGSNFSWQFGITTNFNLVSYTDTAGWKYIFCLRSSDSTDSGMSIRYTKYYNLTEVNFTDNQYYQEGYNQGYSSGLDEGQSSGYTDGYNSGYNVGFGNGRNEGIQNANNYSFLGLFGAMIDAPLNGLRSLFNFEFLGINLLSFITSLLTIALITFVIKKLMGR